MMVTLHYDPVNQTNRFHINLARTDQILYTIIYELGISAYDKGFDYF